MKSFLALTLVILLSSCSSARERQRVEDLKDEILWTRLCERQLDEILSSENKLFFRSKFEGNLAEIRYDGNVQQCTKEQMRISDEFKTIEFEYQLEEDNRDRIRYEQSQDNFFDGK